MMERGSNGINGDQLKGYLEEIDSADDKLLQLKAEHMAACKGPRKRIKETMGEAKRDGVNMASFRTIVAAHRAERKIEERIAALEADDKADFESMQQALGDYGDTPLGAAALAKAKAREGGSDGDRTVDSLRGG